MRPLYQIFIILSLFIAILLPPAVLHAQSSFNMSVSYSEVTEGADALQLDVFFNLVDVADNVIDAKVEQVELQMPDGSLVTANASRPSMPIYVTFLLDSSGSMGAVQDTVRQAASQAVNGAPDTALFSVVTFNESSTVLQDFTSSKDSTVSSIERISAVRDSGTCLYDATYDAISRAASQSAGRRAVIVLTDGVDETRTGNPCSANTLPGVVGHATRSHVPIYVLGIESSGLDRTALTTLADDSGAFAVFGSNVGSMFSEAMDALANQWYAQFQLYPLSGNHTVYLTPVMDGGARGSATPLMLRTNNDYTQPFAFMAGYPKIAYDAARDQVTVELAAHGVGRLASLTVDVVNDDTGMLYTDLTQTFSTLPATIPISCATLTPGDDYRLVFTGKQSSGLDLLAAPFELTFGYEPNTGSGVSTRCDMVIKYPQYDAARQAIHFTLDYCDPARLDRVEIAAIDEFGLSRGVYEREAPVDVLSISTADLDPGDYTIQVLAYDVDGNRAEAEHEIEIAGLPTPTIQVKDAVVHGRDRLDVELAASNTAGVEYTRVSIVRESDNSRAGDILTIEGVPSRFSVPLKDVSGGDYRLVMRPFGPGDALLLKAPVEYEFAVAADTTTLLERIRNIIFWPPISGSIIIALGLMSVFYVRRFAANRGLFGQQGASARGGSSGGAIRSRPADRTPPAVQSEIPMRKATSAIDVAPVAHDKTITWHARKTAYIYVERCTSTLADHRITLTTDNRTFRIGAVSGNLIFPDDASVSSMHCELTYDPQTRGYTLRDVGSNGRGSTWGTRVDGREINGTSVTLDKNRAVRIELGDSVVITFWHEGTSTPEVVRNSALAFLEVYESLTHPRPYRVEISQQKFVVGGEVGDLVLPHDTTVSGTHCVFEYLPNRQTFRVVDVGSHGQGSTNGTVVDGHERFRNDARMLHPHKRIEIQLGDTVKMWFEMNRR